VSDRPTFSRLTWPIMKPVAWTGFMLVASTPMALAQGSTSKSKSTSYSFSTTHTTTRTTTRTSTSTSTSLPSGRPLYKDPNAPIEDRIKDLLPRMTIEEKVAQLIQGDINGWMNMTDPNDNTLTLVLPSWSFKSIITNGFTSATMQRGSST
jgi:hypothetical protein